MPFNSSPLHYSIFSVTLRCAISSRSPFSLRSYSISSSSRFVYMAPFLETQKPLLDGESDHNAAGAGSQTPPVPSRVTVVGSGNWGSVAAKLIASNTLKLNSFHGFPFFFFPFYLVRWSFMFAFQHFFSKFLYL